MPSSQHLPTPAWAVDAQFTTLALAMWLGLAIKVSPGFTPYSNACSAAGATAMFAISLAWPVLAPAHYERWRTPALSALRLILFSLPFHYGIEGQRTFDIISPASGLLGRFPWVYLSFVLFLGTRIALMFNCSLYWGLPLAAHAPVQAVCVGLMMRFAAAPYCSTGVLSSPQADAAAWGLHYVLSTLAALPTPIPGFSASLLVPEGAFERRVAALLFCWAVDGWLLPTLLLIRREAQHKPWPQVGAGDSAAEGLRGRIATAWSRLGCMLYTQLSKLLPARQQRQQQRRTGEPEEQSSGDGGSTAPEGMLLLLRWWLVLVATWAVCCSAAPLFEELPPTQLAPSAS